MICQHFKNLNLTEEVFKNIFAAKRVPLAFLDNFEILREQNREDWEVVRQTISHDEETKDYDYYFDFVKNLIEPFRIHEEKKIPARIKFSKSHIISKIEFMHLFHF